LNPLDVRQRPELLIASLATLPEPFRVRWIAPEASPARVVQLRQIARDAGVEQRLSIDVRSVNAGEMAYLLAHATALIELAPGLLVVGQIVCQASRTGVPVITCVDGGALIECIGPGSPEPSQPDPTALANAIRAAYAAPSSKSATRVQRTQTRGTGWAPLKKALAQ